MLQFGSPARRNRPNGRFWIGKSVAGSFAESTQLVNDGSCVSSTWVIGRCTRSGWERLSRGLDDAAAQLIALDRFEQRLEVALAEALVALALNELEEYGPEQRLGKDLQQQPLLATLGATVEQNAARLQLARLLAMARKPLVEHLVIRRRRRAHERHACGPQAIHACEQIIGQQRDVLDP